MASPNKQGVKAEYCIFDVDGLLSGSKRRTRGHSSELMDAIDGFPRSVRSRWPASIRETDAVEHPCLPSSDTEVRIDCLRIWRGGTDHVGHFTRLQVIYTQVTSEPPCLLV